MFLPLDLCKAFLRPVSYPVGIQAADHAKTCCCHNLLAAPLEGLFLTRSFTRQYPIRSHTCQWLIATQATSQPCIESSDITHVITLIAQILLSTVWALPFHAPKRNVFNLSDTEDDHLESYVHVREPLPRACIPCADLCFYRDAEKRDKKEQTTAGKAVTEAISGWTEVTEWSESIQMPHVPTQQVHKEV